MQHSEVGEEDGTYVGLFARLRISDDESQAFITRWNKRQIIDLTGKTKAAQNGAEHKQNFLLLRN